MNPQGIPQKSSENPYTDLGEAPPPRSFWGQLYQLVRRSFTGRFRAPTPNNTIGTLHFHEILSFDYPLFQGSSLITLRTANTVANLIERFKIDIVNAHYVVPHSTSAILARESGLKVSVVTTLHGTDVTTVGSDPAFSYTTRHAINASDEVTSVCGYLAAECSRSFNVSRPITVIKNWVDSVRFARITDPKARARYAQPEEKILLHVSNFRPIKRPQNVVRIFAKVLESTPARLILVGDGPEKQACIELAVALGVAGRVLSMPECPDIELLMGISDILLLPSEMEGAPLVLLEAMAAGAICIASNVGGIPEVLDHGRTGFMFPPDELGEMANQALTLFTNRDLADTIRKDARTKVVEQHSPEQLIAQYLRVYHAVLVGRGGNERAALLKRD
jgi:N-acetyl-alpha-D-glucosaminyl L-malate synthase BshA